jgi:hypothetical protein
MERRMLHVMGKWVIIRRVRASALRPYHHVVVVVIVA